MFRAQNQAIKTLIHHTLAWNFYFDVLRPTAVQPMTGIEGFKYQACDGKKM